jgi:hypothetical protein
MQISKIWKPVVGYELLYEISNISEVRSIGKNGYILNQRENWGGYKTVTLHKNGEGRTQYVHRLLAKAFLPNDGAKCCVNHKNGNKLDNTLVNLEWVTQGENMKHAYQIGLCDRNKKSSPVKDICTGREFPSVRTAAESLSIPYSTCKNYLNGNRNNPTCLRLVVPLQIAA